MLLHNGGENCVRALQHKRTQGKHGTTTCQQQIAPVSKSVMHRPAAVGITHGQPPQQCGDWIYFGCIDDVHEAQAFLAAAFLGAACDA